MHESKIRDLIIEFYESLNKYFSKLPWMQVVNVFLGLIFSIFAN